MDDPINDKMEELREVQDAIAEEDDLESRPRIRKIRRRGGQNPNKAIPFSVLGNLDDLGFNHPHHYRYGGDQQLNE